MLLFCSLNMRLAYRVLTGIWYRLSGPTLRRSGAARAAVAQSIFTVLLKTDAHWVLDFTALERGAAVAQSISTVLFFFLTFTFYRVLRHCALSLSPFTVIYGTWGALIFTFFFLSVARLCFTLLERGEAVARPCSTLLQRSDFHRLLLFTVLERSDFHRLLLFTLL